MTEQQIPNTPLRFMFHISRPFFWSAVSTLLIVTLVQPLTISVSYVMKELVDAISTGGSKAEALDNLEYWGIVYLVLTALIYAGWRASGIIGVYWLSKSKAYWK